jgi:hypothetical protein
MEKPTAKALYAKAPFLEIVFFKERMLLLVCCGSIRFFCGTIYLQESQ